MTPTHIEHIGIAVRNLESAIGFYERILGLKCHKIEELPDQKVRAAFFRIDRITIELLEPVDNDGPVARFLEKKGEGMHHIAFAVDDLEKSLNEMGEKGIRLIDTVPRRGAGCMDIAFIHPESAGGVLVELCEKRNEK
ncbi:MAG: methylmalonyl-CoA epimerase [Bacteroidales bacterium]|jgi:methylmalonyl-CoA/ethylmalonyl-CoA epimerase|nr:methylmalonyl-CoA epimerase [Bacteroidales bacterium]